MSAIHVALCDSSPYDSASSRRHGGVPLNCTRYHPLLKLKKVQILGFKSFCDRTEVQLAGEGIAVIVGPNGCGKSNISDAITWVLGEQSAKSLRGVKREDVIFAGTRDRNPPGMAEVSLTLIDPEVYDGAVPDGEPEIVIDEASPTDWDETSLRQQSAEETEEAVTEAQPGTVIETEAKGPQIVPPPAEGDASAELTNPNNVVLKIRRRKFGRAPVRAGELTITRRLFRSGDSEYLLNGKICRIRDIQDIFMCSGLGGESYAMTSKEPTGSILSAKPLDRRAIIKEAAGITRFKTKKRLAELRLESAKQNLARVNDIFEEGTRQMNSLKRQAAKAERFVAVREELRTRLRVVLASRMAAMDADQERLDQEIASLSEHINSSAEQIQELEGSQHSLTERGYEIDREGQQAQNRGNEAAVELERARARERANTERVSDLEGRIAAAAAELEVTRTQLSGIAEERGQQHAFLQTAAEESRAFRQKVEASQQEARTSGEEVFAAERQLESTRRQVMHVLAMAGNARNQTAQAEESLAALEREAQRLDAEMGQARNEQENLGAA